MEGVTGHLYSTLLLFCWRVANSISYQLPIELNIPIKRQHRLYTFPDRKDILDKS